MPPESPEPPQKDPPQWGRWLGGAVTALTGTAAALREADVVSHDGIGRVGALELIAIAIVYATRAYVHLRIPYVSRPHEDDTHEDARRRIVLSVLVFANIGLSLALLLCGIHYFRSPSNWHELWATLAATIAMLSLSLVTNRLARALKLKRGSDVIMSCRPVQALKKAVTEDFGGVPGLRRLFVLCWETTTLAGRVSGLMIVLLAALASVALAQGVAVSPQVKAWLDRPPPAHHEYKHKHETSRKVVHKKSVSVGHVNISHDPSTPHQTPLRSYEELCGSAVIPGAGAGTATEELRAVWARFGEVIAGCAQRARLVAGTDDVYVVVGECNSAFRSLAVAGPGRPANMLLNEPATFGHALAAAGKLRGASERLAIGEAGDFQVIYTSEGAYVSIRQDETNGHGGPKKEARKCEELQPAAEHYEVIYPAMALLWLEYDEIKNERLWPARNGPNLISGHASFNFYSSDKEHTKLAFGTCSSPTACKLIAGNLTLSTKPGAAPLSVTRVQKWGPS